ncbi:MAG TPA: hypothetical protein ENK78_04495 [Thiothrix sp.]|nr:hypothetical protein [Thiothrix sp.]
MNISEPVFTQRHQRPDHYQQPLQLKRLLLYFSIAWLFITLTFFLIPPSPLLLQQPQDWLRLFLPLTGCALTLFAYFHYQKANNHGKPSVHLAKAAFRPNDLLNGYVDVTDILPNTNTQAATYIGLVKTEQHALWSTKASAKVTEGKRGTRIHFQARLLPEMALEEPIRTQSHQWMVYIDLQHNEEHFKYQLPIPIQ